jgi:hypothetical protein
VSLSLSRSFPSFALPHYSGDDGWDDDGMMMMDGSKAWKANKKKISEWTNRPWEAFTAPEHVTRPRATLYPMAHVSPHPPTPPTTTTQPSNPTPSAPVLCHELPRPTAYRDSKPIYDVVANSLLLPSSPPTPLYSPLSNSVEHQATPDAHCQSQGQ